MASNDLRAQERGVLIQIASMIVNTAKSLSSWSKHITNAFEISEVSEFPGGMLITIRNTAPEGLAFERGSGIHGPSGEKYIITPRNSNALVFPGTHEWSGQTIVTAVVHHPGVAARPFLHPANEANRVAAMTMLKAVVGNSIKMAIREAWNNK
jgi:hypothetical protein